jgi:cytochrome c6
MYYLKRKFMIAWLAASAITGILLVNYAASAAILSGEAEFKEHCATCHTGGGNIIKADKTLSRKDLEKHGIKTAKDIVRLMRKPGEGMNTFDKKTISDKEAKAIADYIIKTFK